MNAMVEHAASVKHPPGTDVIWRALEKVQDPEIPILSIVDLGIVRHVRWRDDGTLHVGLTPTYSGCPATDVIRGLVRRTLAQAGYESAVIDEVQPGVISWLIWI